jgi:hypothetical protein
VCAEGVCCEGFACAGRCFSARREVHSARVGVETVQVHPADFDADGRDDLFVSTNGENSVSIYWGRSDGELVDVDLYHWGKPGYWLGSGDIDNDGHLDALLLSDDAQTGEHRTLKVRFGDGRRGFERERVYGPTGYNPTFAAAADVNADGLTDVLMLAWRQECVILMLGLGGGELSEPRCVHRVQDATEGGPTFVFLGRDAQGRGHWLGEGSRGSNGLRPIERWVFSPDGSTLDRIESVPEQELRQYTLASVVRAAGDQRMVLRFEVDGTSASRRAWIRSIQPDLSLTSCDRPALDLQTDGAATEFVMSAGDFDGDRRMDYFGLTSLCTGCAGMLYAHLGR